jgi:hypothetical protein
MPRQTLARSSDVFTLDSKMNTTTSADTVANGMTRTHVAKRLGVSIATVRRMEGRELHPTVDERGVRFFAITEVETILVRRRQTPERPPNDEGEVAARVFGLLRHGCDLRTIVITAKVPPRVVRALYAEWLISLQDGEARRRQDEFDAEESRERARFEREHRAGRRHTSMR